LSIQDKKWNCHARESGHPDLVEWIPAFAGMTFTLKVYHYRAFAFPSKVCYLFNWFHPGTRLHFAETIAWVIIQGFAVLRAIYR